MIPSHWQTQSKLQNYILIKMLIFLFYRFVKRFRLSKEAYNYVLEEIEFNGVISTSVQPKIQLAAALSLLASGGFQHNVGNDFIIGVSQSAISRILQKFIVEVETKLCQKFIKFCPGESDDCKEYFLRNYKIPGGLFAINITKNKKVLYVYFI